MITRFKYRNIYDLSKLSNISLLKDLDISSIIDHSHFEHFKKLENDNVHIKAFLMMIIFKKNIRHRINFDDIFTKNIRHRDFCEEYIFDHFNDEMMLNLLKLKDLIVCINDNTTSTMVKEFINRDIFFHAFSSQNDDSLFMTIINQINHDLLMEKLNKQYQISLTEIVCDHFVNRNLSDIDTINALIKCHQHCPKYFSDPVISQDHFKNLITLKNTLSLTAADVLNNIRCHQSNQLKELNHDFDLE